MMDHSTTMLTQQQSQQHPQAQLQHSTTDQTGLVQPDGSSKRKQVKNACTNCQKACKKCDDDRPCSRCVKFGLADTCTSSVRKERKKGIKRGPYKRKGKQDDEQQGRKARKSSGSDAGSSTAEQQHAAPPPPSMYGQVGQVTSAPQQGPISYSYGYPPNLNQYHFLPYQYPYYGGDKASQPGNYAISYPPPLYQYPMQISAPPAPAVDQVATQSTDSSDTNNKQQSVEIALDSELKNVKTEPDNNSSSNNSVKEETKPQPMTPVPSSSSSSTSSTNMSSPGSHQGDQHAKHARLSQLCSAALKQEGSTTAATTD